MPETRFDSSMRPIRETIPLDEALALILDTATPVHRTERVSLTDAHGRVAAADAHSGIDVPPFDRAAMDGYAVRAEDTFGAGRYDPRVLRRIEKVYTGEMPSKPIAPGECTEIATGAPMPEGADAVVMVEETEHADEHAVRVFTPVYPRQNVGRRGADIVAGGRVVSRGDVLNPSRIGALAATGLVDVEVFVKPRIALLSTGNEIIEPGRRLAPGQIYDINRFTLSAIISTHGGEPVVLPTATDSVESLSDAVDAGLQHDLLVFSGGSSVGERDLIMDVLRARGEVMFHGVAVKPGKPTVFGRIENTPVLGMPGYPTSCLSNSYMLLLPVVRRMARLPEHQPRIVQARLARRIVSTTGRHQFYTVTLQDGEARPAFKASGDITSMALADGYIEIAANVDIVEAGETVDVKLF